VRVILILLFSAILFNAEAQQRKHSIRGDFKLPSPLANSALRKTCDGIADVSLSYQVSLYKGVGFGVGYTHLFVRVNEAAINIQSSIVNGSMHRLTPFGKLFYESSKDEQFIVETGIKGGYGFFSFTSDFLRYVGIDSRKGEGLFIEPYLNISLLADDNLAIGLICAYSYTDFAFSPYSIGMDSFPGLLSEEHKGPTHFVSFGFGFTAFLGNQRRR